MVSISVIIPLYNKAEHIERSVRSVLSQTLQPDEIVVVDDGSTDGGAEIVKRFKEPHLRLICQKNSGVSAARNRGITESTGELIAFLDADDVWLPGFLEEIIMLRNLCPQAGIFATAYEIVTEEGLIKQQQFDCLPAGEGRGLITFLKVCFRFPIISSAVVVPRIVFDKLGGFKEGEKYCEDLDMWLRISFHYVIAWSTKYLSRWHRNVANRLLWSRRWEDEPAISRTAREAIAKGLVNPELANELKEFVSNWQLAAVIHLIYLNNKKKALELLLFARGVKRFAIRWWQCRLLIALPGSLGANILKSIKLIKSLRDTSGILWKRK
jgi:glycosyltransferase involved in cell wall biosynthesis